MKENDYCSKCGKPLKIEQLKAMEKKSEQLNLLQEIMAQELEKKGVDLEQMAKILANISQPSSAPPNCQNKALLRHQCLILTKNTQ